MTAKLRALLDSNVLIAALAEDHDHHEPSAALFDGAADGSLAVAAHSYAEAYSTLTRQSGPFAWPAGDAWMALASVAKVTALIGLTPAQTFDAIRGFAQHNGLGPRLYDRLIGEVAVQHRIEVVVTWNTGHMKSLFPQLMIRTPTQGVDR